MAYNAKTDWTFEDDVTETDFNRIEQGIADVEDEATQLASETQDGRMSSEDYSKLAGIEAGAEANDVNRAEFDDHISDGTIHKTSDEIRSEDTTELRTEVVSSFPSHADGRVVYHTGDQRYYGSVNGSWV